LAQIIFFPEKKNFHTVQIFSFMKIWKKVSSHEKSFYFNFGKLGSAQVTKSRRGNSFQSRMKSGLCTLLFTHVCMCVCMYVCMYVVIKYIERRNFKVGSCGTIWSWWK
jgi:hypothetical protein